MEAPALPNPVLKEQTCDMGTWMFLRGHWNPWPLGLPKSHPSITRPLPVCSLGLRKPWIRTPIGRHSHFVWDQHAGSAHAPRAADPCLGAARARPPPSQQPRGKARPPAHLLSALHLCQPPGPGLGAVHTPYRPHGRVGVWPCLSPGRGTPQWSRPRVVKETVSARLHTL